MKIDVTGLKSHENGKLSLDANIHPADLEDEISGIRLTGELHLQAILTHGKGIINLEGVVKGAYRTECARCLAKITGHFEIPLHEKFLPEEKASQDDECYTYQGNRMDLTVPLLDNIMLSFPMVMVCGEDCKGLCMTCGKDLNKGNCSCPRQEGDIRLDKLKDFYKRNDR
ncbi:MAG: DUF177 domain-containing protein [Clostridia bacterium]